ncbi:MAG: GGDEF domain-containing protein, partial [Planctomycetales bacterium]|nr:GGDEF domain-containing protein [Planctomycetales bacterium]
RKQQPFSLCLIDIDHFKQINDTYGHPAGDAVLQHLSSLLQTELDDAVCVARYGGEEFALLTKAPLESAAATLDRLRQTISETEFSHEGSIIPVTLSGGAAAIQNDDQIGRLVRRADEALYAAKLAGRNRVYLHDGTICHLITEIAPVAPATVEDLPSADDSETPAEKSEFAASTSRVQERLQRIIEEESQRLLGRTSE